MTSWHCSAISRQCMKLIEAKANGMLYDRNFVPNERVLLITTVLHGTWKKKLRHQGLLHSIIHAADMIHTMWQLHDPSHDLQCMHRPSNALCFVLLWLEGTSGTAHNIRYTPSWFWDAVQCFAQRLHHVSTQCRNGTVICSKIAACIDTQGMSGKVTCRAEMCLSWLAFSAACTELDAAASCTSAHSVLSTENCSFRYAAHTRPWTIHGPNKQNLLVDLMYRC